LYNQVMPNIYRTEIPLPNNPLKALNSYIIKGSDRYLMIDTGMNRKECLEVMEQSLKELQIPLAKTDFFITHMHSDHSGLVGTLATDSSKIYCSQPDGEIILSPALDSYMLLESAKAHGFPEPELQHVLARHPGFKYAPQGIKGIDFVKDGDLVEVGDYHFRCVATPGHTQGHMCLYEPEKKLFIGGDHLLDDITSNISLFVTGNPLADYLANLEKVSQMDIELVLTGHRRLICDVKKRVEELKEHHRIRAEEVLEILKKGSATGYQVARQMSWDIDCSSWEQFPTPQKWFATGEAIAHLKYLEVLGRVDKEMENGFYIFSLT